ncbi:hypothetical protein ACR8AL_00040 [Clavibacter sepedonicus]|uniref:Membrane protein n=1 Tax=Clavibacter sepedonicus TaxID=31964 RepID=B0RHM3_CLASE|nr:MULTISPECIES: hypothetical protein [Clavibacter]MBD5380509.1 hypothetical protein [Clavibacter sp.]OQJ48157.1 hypothetical protein B5P19_07570 [Clavibacter sepedonicus]OQJ54597.1 hypothetical protein B5P20_11210 [Clavibacter sepedonicus]UUK66172.1 hypothetical protein LRE50_02790 [Clavibacter sepedonicus]CAQ02584.1 putative membrane protein [Clavibacter sepedonicus]
MTDPLDAPDAALTRRLRDDPAAAHRLEELRRAAYGRDGSTAPLVEVPADLRARTGYDEARLPAPLVALLVEEARLVDEGAALLAAERPVVAAMEATTAPEADAEPDADGTPPAPGPSARRRLRPGVLAGAAAGILLVIGIGVASTAGAFDDRTSASPPTSEDVGSAVTATSTPRGQAMGTPDGRRGSVVPDFTADPPVEVPQTEAELAEDLRVRADRAWGLVLEQQPDAVRPDVRMERLVDEAEFIDQQVACLREAGVTASVIGQDSYSLTDADPVAVYACQVRFPQREAGPRTDAELAYIHDYYLSFLLPCYAAEGEPYVGEVPAVDDFIAAVRAERPWTPFPDGMDEQLAAACPVLPAAYR